MIDYIYTVRSNKNDELVKQHFMTFDDAVRYARENSHEETYIEQVELESGDLLGTPSGMNEPEIVWVYTDELVPTDPFDAFTEDDITEALNFGKGRDAFKYNVGDVVSFIGKEGTIVDRTEYEDYDGIGEGDNGKPIEVIIIRRFYTVEFNDGTKKTVQESGLKPVLVKESFSNPEDDGEVILTEQDFIDYLNSINE